MTQINISGIKIPQFNRELIVGAVKASDFVSLYHSRVVRADLYEKGINETGYQRNLQNSRSRSFAKFLTGVENSTQLSANGIILYLRNRKDLSEEGKGEWSISNEISTKPKLWLVDGQHRTLGYVRAFEENWIKKEQDYYIPITVILPDEIEKGLDPKSIEAKIFYEINQHAKRMNTGLARKIISSGSTDSVEDAIPSGMKAKAIKTGIGVKIADHMGDNGPWAGSINAPNETHKIANQTSFVDSLVEPIIYAGGFNWTGKKLTEVLDSYWSAIFAKCPKACSTKLTDGGYAEKRDYLLMRTAGMFVCNRLLPNIMVQFRLLHKDATQKKFEDIFEQINEKAIEEGILDVGPFTDDFWDTDIDSAEGNTAAIYGSSQKSFGVIKDEIQKAINKVIE
jgi:DGQHR domain-containing protein